MRHIIDGTHDHPITEIEQYVTYVTAIFIGRPPLLAGTDDRRMWMGLEQLSECRTRRSNPRRTFVGTDVRPDESTDVASLALTHGS